MFAMAMPRRPRPDSTLVLLLAMAIASGIAFFSVLSDVHAAEPPQGSCEIIPFQSTFDAFSSITASAFAACIGTTVALLATKACLRWWVAVGLRARRETASMLRAIEHQQAQASRSIYR